MRQNSWQSSDAHDERLKKWIAERYPFSNNCNLCYDSDLQTIFRWNGMDDEVIYLQHRTTFSEILRRLVWQRHRELALCGRYVRFSGDISIFSYVLLWVGFHQRSARVLCSFFPSRFITILWNKESEVFIVVYHHVESRMDPLLGVVDWSSVIQFFPVLCCDDNSFHTRFFTYACPLPAVQAGGVEQFRRFVAVSPFFIRKGVHGEMNESVKLQIVPDQLPFRWQGAHRFRRRNGSFTGRDKKQGNNEQEKDCWGCFLKKV